MAAAFPGSLPFPIDPLTTRPDIGAAEAAGVGRDGFRIEADASPLPGERDRNFLLRKSGGKRFVLKISNASERDARLELQRRLVLHARARDPALRLPEVVPAANGADRILRSFGGREHRVRLFRYLEGTPLSEFRRRPPALLDAIGRLAGRLRRALRGFEHPALDLQEIPWAPRHAGAVIGAAAAIVPEPDRRRVYRTVAAEVLPDLPRLLALPAAAIHNDLNDDNLILTAGEPESATPERLAVLDFGDAVRAPSLIEGATAALYAALGTREPLRAAAAVLAGFARERPVSEEESSLFRTAIAARALVSAGVAALRREGVPEVASDGYLLTSETGVWQFLRALEGEPAGITSGRFRLAAGHDPLPDLARRAAAIGRAARGAAPPIQIGSDVRILDLTPGSPALDPAAARETLARSVAAATAGGRRAIGRYHEPRLPEISPGDHPPLDEPSTFQLGIEVFVPAGTPVAAPLDGKVAWAAGAALVLRHESGGVAWWTSYRHLDPPLPAHGHTVRRGDPLGRVAGPAGNGGWPPHLHFQVTVSDFGGPPPRKAAPRDLPLLGALSPDPSAFLGLDSRAAAGSAEASRLLELRGRHISKALSLAYHDPIQLVRGRGARLYDAAGRDFLDMVNNVCHVGHAHPRIAAAIARQAGLLNTNTRYLYRQLTDYAERLAATLPDPLEVVFLTNSGSEANDLALRIARTHLGRRETLVFDGGYHGNLTSLIEISPYKLDGSGGGPAPAWLHRLPMPDGYRGRFRNDGPDFPAALIADVRRRVREAGPATLVGEAILSCGGQIVPPPGYLRALYRAVRAAGGVIVADEVQTGFGRVGPQFWAFAAVQEGAPEPPDIVTLGKPAGNGHPLGAVVTTRALARSFETGMEYFNTFGGNPVSCAAGLAVLDTIRDEGLAEHAAGVGARLFDGLGALSNRYPILGEVRGRGLFLGFEMVRDPDDRIPATAETRRLVNRLRDFRILNAADGPDANVIKIKPPLPFSSADADRYLATLEVVLKEQF